MSHLESLISRYLDGELNPAELQELRQRLDESPEARSLLREMTAVTRSARAIPSLDTPSPSLEARLFHRLEAEGLGRGRRRAPAATSASASLPSRSRIPGRPAMALLLLLFSLTTSYWLSRDADRVDAPLASRDAATTVAPRAGSVVPESVAPSTSDIAQAPVVSSRRFPSGPAPLIGARKVVRRRNTNPGNRSTNAEAQISLPQFQAEESFPPVVPTPRDENRDLANTQTPPRLPDENPPAYVPPVERPQERATPGRESTFAAAFRPTGVAFDDNGTPDLSLRLDARVGRDHQVSFIVGRSPLRSEQRATALLSMSPAMASSDNNGGPSLGKRNAQETTTIELENETWGGVGYSYTLARLGQIETAIGVKAGAGSKSMRLGLEGTVRYSVSDIVAFECVPTLTHVIPHDQSSSMRMVQDESTGTLSFSQSKHSNFTAAGLEVGVRISLR